MIFLHALRRTRRAPASLPWDGLRTNEFAVVHERTRRADEEHPPCDQRNPGHHLQGAKIHERNSPSFTNNPPCDEALRAGDERNPTTVASGVQNTRTNSRASTSEPDRGPGRGKGAGTTRRKGARGLERSMVSASLAVGHEDPLAVLPIASAGAGPMLLSRMLRPLIRIGRLTVIDANGQRHVFGSEAEPAVTVRLHDPSCTGSWRSIPASMPARPG